MTVAYVKDAGLKTASGFSGTTSGSFASLPIVGNHVIVGLSLYDGASVGIDTCVDNQSNSYQEDHNYFGSFGGSAGMYSTKVVTSAGTFTITLDPFNASNNYIAWTAVEFSGLDAATHLDQVGENNNAAGDANVTASGANTTSDGVAIGVAFVNNVDTDINIGDTPPSGYTNIQVNEDSQNIIGFSMVYKIYSAPETSSAAWTHDNVSQTGWRAVIATYKAAAGGGGPTGIASGVICLWTGTNASIPSGWSRVTALDDKYVKGSAAAVNPGGTGGALTHSHTTTGHVHTANHTHTVPNSPVGSGSTNRDTGTVRPIEAHTHVSNADTANPATSLSSASPSTDSVSHEPAYFTVIYIQSDGTPSGFPVDAVVLWNASAGSPTGWNLADGGGGRPDMRNRFIKGAAAAGNGGGTGGTDTHSHTVASHDHGTNFSHNHPNVTSSQTASSLPGGSISGANVSTATGTHTHALDIGNQATDAITGNTDPTGSDDHKPAYTVEAFIQNNSGDQDLHIGLIALWIGTLASIPAPWVLCDGGSGTPDLRGQFVRGANTLGDIGSTGGNVSHGHTATGHTHAVASHNHTVAAAAGAASNATAGATAVATGAHTHPSWANTGASSFTSGSGTPAVANYTDTQPPFYTVAFIQLVRTKSPPPYQKHTLYLWRKR